MSWSRPVDEALQAIDQGVPDVLLSDVEMPGRDGYDLIGLSLIHI